MNKTELRQWVKQERFKLDMKALSKDILKNLTRFDIYLNSKNVLFFYPLQNEVNLLGILKDKTKKFYLPKIDGQNLLCCPFSEGEKTCLSCFKTCEPTSEPCEKNTIDLAIIPALAVDKNGYRLGYGGGFYDRFLKDFDGIKIVCIPSLFVLDNVFREKHDVKADYIITEKDS